MSSEALSFTDLATLLASFLTTTEGSEEKFQSQKNKYWEDICVPCWIAIFRSTFENTQVAENEELNSLLLLFVSTSCGSSDLTLNVARSFDDETLITKCGFFKHSCYQFNTILPDVSKNDFSYRFVFVTKLRELSDLRDRVRADVHNEAANFRLLKLRDLVYEITLPPSLEISERTSKSAWFNFLKEHENEIGSRPFIKGLLHFLELQANEKSSKKIIWCFPTAAITEVAGLEFIEKSIKLLHTLSLKVHLVQDVMDNDNMSEVEVPEVNAVKEGTAVLKVPYLQCYVQDTVTNTTLNTLLNRLVVTSSSVASIMKKIQTWKVRPTGITFLSIKLERPITSCLCDTATTNNVATPYTYCCF